jgi:hypothetical protein
VKARQEGVGMTPLTGKTHFTHSKNYMSKSILHLIGNDLGKFLLGGWGGEDRGAKLEKEWSIGVQEGIYNTSRLTSEQKTEQYFERPYLSFWYHDKKPDYKIPLYFPNLTNVERGMLSVVSPVDMEFPGCIDLLDSMYHKPGGEDVSLRISTAALLSARFPYLNPGGKINHVGHFVDGGYYDNNGSITALNIYDNCLKIRETADSSSLIKRVDFFLVAITNSEPFNVTKIEKIPQLSIPPSTVSNMTGNSNYWTPVTRARIDKEHLIEFELDHTVEITVEGKTFAPIIPLTRYMSTTAISSIISNLEVSNPEFERMYSLMSP